MVRTPPPFAGAACPDPMGGALRLGQTCERAFHSRTRRRQQCEELPSHDRFGRACCICERIPAGGKASTSEATSRFCLSRQPLSEIGYGAPQLLSHLRAVFYGAGADDYGRVLDLGPDGQPGNALELGVVDRSDFLIA